jgi:hypothetical protein
LRFYIANNKTLWVQAVWVARVVFPFSLQPLPCRKPYIGLHFGNVPRIVEKAVGGLAAEPTSSAVKT